MNEEIPRVHASYARIIGRRGFVERFYNVFLDSRPEIASLFKHTDFAAQEEQLKAAIHMAIQFPAGDKSACDALSRIRESHNRNHMQIKPEYYIHWLNSLVATIAEYDSEFDDELEGDWRRILQTSLNYIKEGY